MTWDINFADIVEENAILFHSQVIESYCSVHKAYLCSSLLNNKELKYEILIIY